MIRVLRTGLRAIPEGNGRVLHTSQRAVNLEFGDRVVTILNRRGVLTPSSIILEADHIPDIRTAYFEGGILKTNSFDAELRNMIDLEAHLSGRADIQFIRDALRPHIEAKERSIMGAVMLAEGSTNVPHRSGMEGAVLFEEARRLKECSSVVDAAKSLLGIGFGLTPSGDDFILGAIAVIKLSGRSVEQLRFHVERYSNSFSRTMLLDGLNGYFPEPLVRVINVLESHGNPYYEVKDLERIGHTSGYDIVAGMYYTSAHFLH